MRVKTSKLLILDRYGYPVTSIRGRWFFNLLRKIIHGKSFCRIEVEGELSKEHYSPDPDLLTGIARVKQ